MTLRRSTGFAYLGMWAFILVASGVARADVIFTNFDADPTQPFVLFNGNPVGNGFDGNMAYAQGEAFTPTQDYTLTSITLPLSFGVSGDGPQPTGAISTDITVALTSDAGNQPGSVLESFTIPSNTVLALVSTAPNNAFVFNATSVVPLAAGTQYWVTVSDGTTIDPVRWNWNTQFSNTFNENASSMDGGATWTVPVSPFGSIDSAFEVDGVPGQGSPAITVPEPGGLVLAASGIGVCLLGVWLSRRFDRRRAINV